MRALVEARELHACGALDGYSLKGTPMKYGTPVVLTGLGAFLTLLAAAFAQDILFAQHMGLICAVLAIATVVLLRMENFKAAPKSASGSSPSRRPR